MESWREAFRQYQEMSQRRLEAFLQRQNAPLPPIDFQEPLPWIMFDNRPLHLPMVSAVYIAMAACGQVLYVGQTRCLEARVSSHRHHTYRSSRRVLHQRHGEHWDWLDCKKIAWYMCPVTDLLNLEAACIHKWTPNLNRSIPPLGVRGKRIIPMLPDTLLLMDILADEYSL